MGSCEWRFDTWCIGIPRVGEDGGRLGGGWGGRGLIVPLPQHQACSVSAQQPSDPAPSAGHCGIVSSFRLVQGETRSFASASRV